MINFIKHVWVTGEVVTAELLNRIEDAIFELSQGDSDATDTDCDELFDGFLEDEVEG